MKKTVFITGATGFIGGALVSHLLESDSVTSIVALDRGETGYERRRRLTASVARFVGVHRAADLRDRITIIRGDLTDTSWHDDSRLDLVTHAVHLAANTSFSVMPGMHQTNVLGALLVATAMKGRPLLQRYLHVGTAMICGTDPPPLVGEDDYPSADVRYAVPYAATKARAEQELAAAAEWLPLVMVRPSIVVGHTVLGCSPSGSIFWTFRAADALRRIAWESNSAVDVIPVDFAAAALGFLLDAPSLRYRRYHVSAGADGSVNWQEIAAAFQAAAGAPAREAYRSVSFEEITEHDLRGALGVGPVRKMRYALELYHRFGRLNVAFDNRRLLAEGMPPPPRFTSYLRTCVQTSASRSIYDQMRDE